MVILGRRRGRCDLAAVVEAIGFLWLVGVIVPEVGIVLIAGAAVMERNGGRMALMRLVVEDNTNELS